MHATAPLPLLRSHRRGILQALTFTLAVVLALGLMPVGTATAAPLTVAQCNGIANVGGQGIDCSVTIVNTFDAATGLGSSTVTVQSCTGAANAANTCVGPTTTAFPDVTTTVDQCNGSASGGGGTATCTVTITNNITAGATPVAATVRQCIGSGTGGGTAPTTVCDPVSNTTGATVDQCNGSGNGGGGTMRVRCNVALGSTQSASLPVSVNQCNVSANGGGAFLTCRTSTTNNLIAAPAQPAPSASATATATIAPSASPSAVASAAPSSSPATPVAPAPTTVPDVPLVPDETGVLPEVLVPVAAPPAVGAPVPVSSALPTTGVDASLLSLLGLLTLAIGGGLVLLARPPRGRHVLR